MIIKKTYVLGSLFLGVNSGGFLLSMDRAVSTKQLCKPETKKYKSAENSLIIAINQYNPQVKLSAKDLAKIISLEMAETQENQSGARGNLGSYKNIELSLANCGLLVIPAGLEKLRLIKINLSHNHFQELPPIIAAQPSLCQLDLSDNKVQALSASFAQLTKLERLNLEGNQLAGVTPIISSLTYLESLYIGRNPIKAVSEIFLPRFLRFLSLNNCKLIEMPAALLVLDELFTLDLSYNKIPSNKLSQLAALTNLRNLNLSGNNLSTFPNNLWSLQLDVLFLDDNNLNEAGIALPEEESIEPLRTLSIARNKLERFPKGLEVRNLNAAGNPMREISSDLFDTRQAIDAIDLSGCLINYLPSSMKHATVREVDISNNPLEYTNQPSQDFALALPLIITFERLTKLDLSRCKIKQIPEECGRLVWLELLILDCNELTQLPYTIADLRSLQRLSLYQNSFSPSTSTAALCCYNIIQGTAFSHKTQCVYNKLQACKNLPGMELLDNQIDHLEKVLNALRTMSTLRLARAILLSDASLEKIQAPYLEAKNLLPDIFNELKTIRGHQVSFLKTMTGKEELSRRRSRAYQVYYASEDEESFSNESLSSDEEEQRYHTENAQERFTSSDALSEFQQDDRTLWSKEAESTYEFIFRIQELMSTLASLNEHLRFIVQLAMLANIKNFSFGNMPENGTLTLVSGETEISCNLPKDVKKIIWNTVLSEKKITFDAADFKWVD